MYGNLVEQLLPLSTTARRHNLFTELKNRLANINDFTVSLEHDVNNEGLRERFEAISVITGLDSFRDYVEADAFRRTNQVTDVCIESSSAKSVVYRKTLSQ